MTGKFQQLALLGLALFAVASPRVVSAQDTAAPLVEEASDLAAEIEELRGRLEASDLEDAFKVPALENLTAANDALDTARDFVDRTVKLKDDNKTAPSEIERLKEQLSTPREDVASEVPQALAELHQTLESERAALAERKAELAAATDLLNDVKSRPVEIATRLPVANSELSQAGAKLAALGDSESESLIEAAERLMLNARVQSLEAEIGMLQKEQEVQAPRESLADLKQRLAERIVDRARERVTVLQQQLDSSQEREIDRLLNETQRLAGKADGDLKLLADGLPDLVGQLGSADQRLSAARADLKQVGASLEELQKENRRLQREVEAGGLDGAFSRILLDRSRRLPDRHTLDFELRRLEERISDAQFRGFEIEDMQDEQRRLEQKWDGEAEAKPILELRADLLDRLSLSQRELIQDLARLRAEKAAYRDLVVGFSDFLSTQLFWSPSSKPVGPDFFRDLPAGVAWVIAPQRWRDLWISFGKIPGRHPVSLVAVSLVLMGLVVGRRRLWTTIEHSEKRIRRISTDRMVHTLRALLASLLLALPIPLALWFLGWSLRDEPSAETWVRGFSSWLEWASFSLMWIFSLRVLAAPGGVGRVHFGWNPEASEMLRRALVLLPIFYLPALLIASVTMYEADARYFDSVGRLGIIVAELGIAGVILSKFRPSTGVLSCIVRDHPDWLLSRTSGLWFGALVGIPLVLAGMAVAGYTLTAITLSEQFLISLRWVAGGFVAYGVLLRFFLIKQRRIVLNEAIRERKERREAAEKGDERTEETVTVDDEDIDIEAGAQQIRRLLRALIGIGVLCGIWYGVSAALPVTEAAAGLSIDGRLTGLGVMQAVLIALVTITAVKNLPGLLDLGGMRESGVTPGTRYAVATLAQYAVAAIGILLVTQALELDWSQFGWIAAALSVGLGFGLQEVVANFVCGIIILFERPVRVGDVVTVGEVTGTISRIRMRATTITNWDRQEFVVPNKDFITGSLINWTLSNPVNRLTIEVGVAYGSDTIRAREILAEVAADHPVVLEDPAPLITFDQFADSTLNLAMRIYLPNMDNRLKTRTEIHEEVDRRFKEAGIEIAFPQRDLHLRTVPNEMIRGKAEPPGLEHGDNS